MQRTAAAVAQLDVLISFAAVAAANGYCMPQVDLSDAIEITQDGTRLWSRRSAGACSCRMTRLWTAGKTVWRSSPDPIWRKVHIHAQVALIVLMAQIGSFVPAKHARIGIVDHIFTRIGASDDLASGQSTFMVEMTEIADILKHATAKSLLVLDEVGRGTSTYDGMSIARAVLVYCGNRRRLGAKTLFATHYHELTALEGELPGALNFNIAVKKRGRKHYLSPKNRPGRCGPELRWWKWRALPAYRNRWITRARELLIRLEENRLEPAPACAASGEEAQISLRDIGAEKRPKGFVPWISIP